MVVGSNASGGNSGGSGGGNPGNSSDGDPFPGTILQIVSQEMVGDMMVVTYREVVPVVVVVEAVVPVVVLVKMLVLLLRVVMVEQVFNYHQPLEILNL